MNSVVGALNAGRVCNTPQRSRNVTPPVVVACDPGDVISAWLVWDTSANRVLECGIDLNGDLFATLPRLRASYPAAEFAIEMIASYGMPVGATIFETCVWIGRFVQVWTGEGACHCGACDWNAVYRKDVKLNLCGSPRAKDGNVSQALRDRFGEVGTKKNPGPLYGIKSHLWSALAVGVTFADSRRLKTSKTLEVYP